MTLSSQSVTLFNFKNSIALTVHCRHSGFHKWCCYAKQVTGKNWTRPLVESARLMKWLNSVKEEILCWYYLYERWLRRHCQICGTPSCHTDPQHCAYKIKKTALARKHVAKLQSSFLSSLGQDSHQSWSLSLPKWNCTHFRNRNYAGFCEPFFPISDLWICGMTPATRITTSNCFIQSIIFTNYWASCKVECTTVVRKGIHNKLWCTGWLLPIPLLVI